MKPRDYCCCAIPIVDAGIYATLTEQVALGIIVGTLSLATPSSMYHLPVSGDLTFTLLLQSLAPSHPPWPRGF